MVSNKLPESKCDVLIIGAGPAGLMSAAWMARCGINARIVDKRGTKIFNGQADGLQCRTLEIFDSFGFADRAWKEANHMLELSMWNPDKDGIIRRSDRMPDVPPGISRFAEIVLHQGRIERFFLDHIKKHSNIEVERGVLPSYLHIDKSVVNDVDAYPISVELTHLSEEEATPEQQKGKSNSRIKIQDGLFRSNLASDDTEELVQKNSGKEGTSEIVHAKFVLGCDGAHSWTRQQLGFEMEGEATDSIWGVIDVIPITDFPDIRNRCLLHSANSGSLMVIPRENKLVRFYIQLKEIKPDASGRADRSKITPETILKAAQKTIEPYKLTYEYCDWWTAYQIGQRVGTSFSAHNRVFLAGDAIHTHSPKAGQGMNVSMQDAYNLGWKIALAVRKTIPLSLLSTYELERRRIAQDLIAFDQRFSRLFSGRPARDIADEEGVSMEEFAQVFRQGALFAAGLSVDYPASLLVAKPHLSSSPSSSSSSFATSKQHLAKNTPLGQRFPSFKVLNQAGARPHHLQSLLRSDGRFRIILFAGDISDPTQHSRMLAFCAALDSPRSFAHRHTTGPDPSGVLDDTLELLTVHAAARAAVELLRDFPAVLHPFDARTGWDYDCVYADDESYHEGHGRAYEGYGVDRARGCVVAVRPDQYVGWIGELEDVEDLGRYFEGIFGSGERRG